ncbi:MAG: alanine racemase, partial [Oscillospiraceae bacterium]|nr:alanine racemase [Oscillospiraceae bacterium]
MNSFVIEREKIESNTAEIFRRAGDRTVFAVVKGRGYGFGIPQYVPLLHSLGIRHFAVTDTSDALEIRRLALPETEILMLVSTALPDELNALIENDIILTIGSTECAVAANGIAFSKNKIAKVHIKIDTGMGRYGFIYSQKEELIKSLKKIRNIRIEGTFSHFSCSYFNEKYTRQQFENFLEI